jgi:hypothetical protein
MAESESYEFNERILSFDTVALSANAISDDVDMALSTNIAIGDVVLNSQMDFDQQISPILFESQSQSSMSPSLSQSTQEEGPSTCLFNQNEVYKNRRTEKEKIASEGLDGSYWSLTGEKRRYGSVYVDHGCLFSLSFKPYDNSKEWICFILNSQTEEKASR